MGRQRKPTALHEITDTLNVTRHRGRAREPKTGGEIGPPPNNWPAPGRALWYELRGQVPARVGTSSDKAAFELLVRLFWSVREDHANLTPAMASQIRCALGMFGLSPASRATLSVPPARKPDGPAARFFED